MPSPSPSASVDPIDSRRRQHALQHTWNQGDCVFTTIFGRFKDVGLNSGVGYGVHDQYTVRVNLGPDRANIEEAAGTEGSSSRLVQRLAETSQRCQLHIGPNGAEQQT